MLFKLYREPRMAERVLKRVSVIMDSYQEQKLIIIISLLRKRLRGKLCAGSLLSSALGIHTCGPAKGVEMGREIH